MSQKVEKGMPKSILGALWRPGWTSALFLIFFDAIFGVNFQGFRVILASKIDEQIDAEIDTEKASEMTSIFPNNA